MKTGYLIVVVAIMLFAISMAGCRENAGTGRDPHPNRSHEENGAFATPENPVVSPSGDFVMAIEAGFNDNVYDNHFVVYLADIDDDPLFVSDKNYRTRDRLYFVWDEHDNIWVYSGDIGTTVCLKESDIWTEQYPAQGDGPMILQEALSE